MKIVSIIKYIIISIKKEQLTGCNITTYFLSSHTINVFLSVNVSSPIRYKNVSILAESINEYNITSNSINSSIYRNDINVINVILHKVYNCFNFI